MLLFLKQHIKQHEISEIILTSEIWLAEHKLVVKLINISLVYTLSIRVVREHGVVVRRCSVKKVFLEILQNSQENTCARVSFLIKLQA